MATSRSSTVRWAVALAAIAAIAVWVALRWTQPGSEPAEVPPRGHDASLTIDARSGRGPDDDAGEAVRVPIDREPVPHPAALTYLVVQEDGRRVAGPSVFVAAANLRSVPAAPVAVGAADGCVRLPPSFELPSGFRLVFWAPGFLSAAVDVVEGGTVTLRRGQQLEGIALDRSNRPVSGLRIALSRTSMTSRTVTSISGPAVPAPGAHAVHTAVSGPDGRFVVDGLSPAPYRVQLHHDRLCVCDASPLRADVVTVPSAFLTIRMDSLHAARLRVEGSTLCSVSFRLPEWRCRSPLGALSAESLMASLGLRNGWSADSASYYVAPGTEAPPGARSATIALFFPDSPMQVIEADFHPLDEGLVRTITATPDPSLAAEVLLHATDSRGTSLDGLSLNLMRSHTHDKDDITESHRASVGDSVRIGKGVWRVSTSHPVLNRLIAVDAITIQDATQEVKLVFDEVLHRVVVECEDFAAGDCLLQVQGEAGARTSALVRDGEQAQLWLPAGAYQFAVSRFGCRNGTARATIPTDGRTDASKVVVRALEPE